jgi:hypothetical protein
MSRLTARAMFMAIGALNLTGCATVIRGPGAEVTVVSSPPGASVRTSRNRGCDETPCTFSVGRNRGFDVTVSKPGYQDWTGHVHRHVTTSGAAAFLGNGLFGGLIGAGVDIATGAPTDPTPNRFSVSLAEIPGWAESHRQAMDEAATDKAYVRHRSGDGDDGAPVVLQPDDSGVVRLPY